MGFMAGFGDAFATSFENSRDRRAKREEDDFRLTFDEYTKRRDEKMKYDREDAKYAKQAAGIAQLAGVDDPKAVAWFYDQIKAGFDPDTLLKEARKPGAKFTSTASETAPSTKAKQTELQQQMSGSGLAPDQPTVDTQTPAPEEKGDFWSKLFPGRKSPQARAKELADANVGRIAQVTGQDPSEVQGVMTGDYQSQNLFPDSGQVTFTPGRDEVKVVDRQEAVFKRDHATDPVERQLYDDMVKAADAEIVRKAQAEAAPFGTQVYVATDKDGRRVQVSGTLKDGQVYGPDNQPLSEDARPITEAETKLNDALASKAEDAQKFRATVANTVSLYKEGGEIISLAEQNPIVLTGVGSVAEIAESLTAEGKAAMEVLSQAEMGSPEADSAVSRLENMLKKAGIANIANNKSLFDTKILTMAYRAAAAEGQKGQGASNKDFERVLGIINSSGGDPKKFATNLSQYLDSLRKDSDDSKFLPYNQLVENYKKTFGYSPEEPLVGVDEALSASEDPNIKKVLQYIDSPPIADEAETQSNPAEENSEGSPAEGNPEEQNLPVFNSPAEVDAAIQAGTLKPGDQFKVPGEAEPLTVPSQSNPDREKQ